MLYCFFEKTNLAKFLYKDYNIFINHLQKGKITIFDKE